MTDSNKQQTARKRRHGRTSGLSICAAVATVAFAVSLVAIASAGTTTVSIGSASNAKLGEQVVVSSQGRTLYTLSGETAGHLKCKTSECLKFWPPVTVPSRTTKLKLGGGVHGKLAIMRRSNGMLQVTLRGVPLYRFLKDTAKGQVNGQGIESFGGTWSATTATAGEMPKEATTTTTPMPTPTTPANPPYGY
jgi:predicted lipoprotein with Yx(FWY)xxD motif